MKPKYEYYDYRLVSIAEAEGENLFALCIVFYDKDENIMEYEPARLMFSGDDKDEVEELVGNAFYMEPLVGPIMWRKDKETDNGIQK